MIMDGYTVVVGDAVHDVLYGGGVVMELLPADRMRVKFSTKPHGLVFGSNGVGVRYTQRTLFWRDPIIAVPLKNDRMWNMVRPTIDTLVKAIRFSFSELNVANSDINSEVSK